MVDVVHEAHGTVVVRVLVPVWRHAHRDDCEVHACRARRRAAHHCLAQRRDVGREGRSRVSRYLVGAERVGLLVKPDGAGAEAEAESHVLPLVRRESVRRHVEEHGAYEKRVRVRVRVGGRVANSNEAGATGHEGRQACSTLRGGGDDALWRLQINVQELDLLCTRRQVSIVRGAQDATHLHRAHCMYSTSTSMYCILVSNRAEYRAEWRQHELIGRVAEIQRAESVARVRLVLLEPLAELALLHTA